MDEGTGGGEVNAQNFKHHQSRSDPQNDLFHTYCRKIKKHLCDNAVRVTEETTKELILLKLGNTRKVMGEKVAMRSSKYKKSPSQLTEAEVKAGIISMTCLVESMISWAATDLNLNLVES